MHELFESETNERARPRNMTVAEESDALLAVVAHGLIDAAYPALMAGHTLQREDLPAELREELVGIVVDKTKIVVERLQDLMRGVPPELFEAMETLNARDA